MGYIKLHAIVIRGWSDDFIIPAHLRAMQIVREEFADDITADNAFLVSPLIPGATNGQVSFFVASDGSKEGWSTSECGDKARDRIIEFLEADSGCDYAEIIFGGDDRHESILRSRNKEEEE